MPSGNKLCDRGKRGILFFTVAMQWNINWNQGSLFLIFERAARFYTGVGKSGKLKM